MVNKQNERNTSTNDLTLFLKNNPDIILNESDFLRLFGTVKQYEKYSGKTLNTHIRESILGYANCYADVSYIRINRKPHYQISNVREKPIPQKILKMKQGLYQYTIPLILDKVLAEPVDETGVSKANLTVNGFAKRMLMVNNNYNYIKFNKENAMSDDENDFEYLDKQNEYVFGYCEQSLLDFFHRADVRIDYIVNNTLEILKKAGFIEYEVVTMVAYHGEKGRRATEEEKKIEVLAIENGDKVAGIDTKGLDTASTRYYSSKSRLFLKGYSEILKQNNIAKFYKSIEVYAINRENNQYLLETYFPELNSPTFIENFNRDFLYELDNNLINRLDNKKYGEIYARDFMNLAKVTIAQSAPSVYKLVMSNDEISELEEELYMDLL